MKAGVFATGTDTGVGKTLVTTALLRAACRSGLRAVGMKPVAAGTDALGHQEDVEALIAAGNVAADRALINPYCFAPPIAPHIAATEATVAIDGDTIGRAFQTLSARADFVAVEGAGGILVPLGPAFDTADLAGQLDLPVLIVVGLRLGCINHALLTIEAIVSRKLRIAGWIANCVDPEMARRPQNVDSLRARIDYPLLAQLDWGVGDEAAAMAMTATLDALFAHNHPQT